MISLGGHQRRSKWCSRGRRRNTDLAQRKIPPTWPHPHVPRRQIFRRTDSAQIHSFPRTTNTGLVDPWITPHDVRLNIVTLSILAVAFGKATCARQDLRWCMCKGRDLFREAITTGMTRWCVDGHSRVVKDLQLAVGVCHSRSWSVVRPVGIVSFPLNTPQLLSRSF